MVKVRKSGQQRNDTTIAIHSNLTFPLVGRVSVDAFSRFSRLQTRSNDLKTSILFSVNFRFPDMNRKHGIDQTDIEKDLPCLPVFLAGCEQLVVLIGDTYKKIKSKSENLPAS